MREPKISQCCKQTTFCFKEKSAKNHISSYQTKEFIEDLRVEIQRQSVLLAEAFPARVNEYKQAWLSSLMGRDPHYLTSFIFDLSHNRRDTGIADTDLFTLKTNLDTNYGILAFGCVELIKQYLDGKIGTLTLVDRLLLELGRISGQISISDKELGLILAGSKRLIKGIKERFNPNNVRAYNPEYMFSIERLGKFEKRLESILGHNVKACLDIINFYKTHNKDLKLYSNQRFTIKNEYFFKSIEDYDQFYWLGFLCADGYISKSGEIGLKLSSRDEDMIIQFAEKVGYPLEKLKQQIYIYQSKGRLKSSKFSLIKFSCSLMEADLKRLGFLQIKSKELGLPYIIKNTISKAKVIAARTGVHWTETSYGKKALCFLAGFYDGDGSYVGGYSAILYNTNKQLLDDIKSYYDINLEVFIAKEIPYDLEYLSLKSYFGKQNYPLYRLTIGSDLFKVLCGAYLDGMTRKRP